MCRREWRREKKVERECFSDHVDDNIHLSGIHNYILDAWPLSVPMQQTDISGGVLDAPAV